MKSVEAFLKLAGSNHRERGIFPYCPECDERLSITNSSNIEKTTFYRHYPNKNADDDKIETCSLRDKNSNRQGWYCDSFDFQLSKKVREAFLEKENLTKSYVFCLLLCGKGNLSFETFKDMIKLADRKKIWAYSSIKLWAIPYMLLTLRNFKHASNFDFHFILHKQGNNKLSVIELLQSTSEIQKVFSNTTQLMSKSLYNPYPISEGSYWALLEEHHWLLENNEFSEKLHRYICGEVGKHHPHP